MTPAEVLDATAKYIEEHGHFQGDYFSSSGAVCVRGALMMVTPQDLELRSAAYSALFDRVGRSPIAWNDDATTTGELVTKTLRATAADLRGES